MKQTEVTMKKIGSTKFYITPFPAFTAARISGELSEVLAPMLGSLAPLLGETGSSENSNGVETDIDSGKEKGIMDMEVDKVLPAFSDALGTLSGEKFEHLMKQLLVNYKNISFDDEDGDVRKMSYDDANEIFCGEIQDMLLLCWEVIKINFGGFFRKLAGPSGSLQDVTERLTGRKTGGKNGAN